MKFIIIPWEMYVKCRQIFLRKVYLRVGPITHQRDRSRESQRNYSYIIIVTELQLYGQLPKLKINIIRILTLFFLYILPPFHFNCHLIVGLDFDTQINKTFKFIYLLDKNIITNTPNQISTNRKIDQNKKSINFALKS